MSDKKHMTLITRTEITATNDRPTGLMFRKHSKYAYILQGVWNTVHTWWQFLLHRCLMLELDVYSQCCIAVCDENPCNTPITGHQRRKYGALHSSEAATTLTQPTTLDEGACEPRVGNDWLQELLSGWARDVIQPGCWSRPPPALAATPPPLGWPWNYVNIATSV